MELVLVGNTEGVHHTLHIAVVAGKEGGEYVLRREHARSAAQLDEVPLIFQGEHTLALPIEVELRGEFPFGRPVLETVGDVAAQADESGEMLGGTPADGQSQALGVVVHDGTGPSAILEFPVLQADVLLRDGSGDGKGHVVHGQGLDFVHHPVNTLFAFRERIRAGLVPVRVVPVLHIAGHHGV